jgi:hypothetical protein
MGIQSISAGKALPDGDFGQKSIIDAHQCRGSRNQLHHPASGSAIPTLVQRTVIGLYASAWFML